MRSERVRLCLFSSRLPGTSPLSTESEIFVVASVYVFESISGFRLSGALTLPVTLLRWMVYFCAFSPALALAHLLNPPPLHPSSRCEHLYIRTIKHIKHIVNHPLPASNFHCLKSGPSSIHPTSPPPPAFSVDQTMKTTRTSSLVPLLLLLATTASASTCSPAESHLCCSDLLVGNRAYNFLGNNGIPTDLLCAGSGVGLGCEGLSSF